MRIHPHGKHAGLALEGDGPFEIVGGRGAAIGGPHLDRELACQEDRAGRFAAPEVQDPHAGAERKVARQTFRLA